MLFHVSLFLYLTIQLTLLPDLFFSSSILHSRSTRYHLRFYSFHLYRALRSLTYSTRTSLSFTFTLFLLVLSINAVREVYNGVNLNR